MPKLEDKGTYFEVDGVPYDKGKVVITTKGNNVGMRLVKSKRKIAASVIYSDWTDGTDTPYASAQALVDDFTSIVFKASTNKDLFIAIGGQSNTGVNNIATGRVDYADIPPHLVSEMSNVFVYNNAGDSFSAFTQDIAQQWGWVAQSLFILSKSYRNIYFVKVSEGGSYIYSGGAIAGVPYPKADFKTFTNNAIANLDLSLGAGTYEKVVFWQLGFTDGLDETASLAHELELTNWFADIRANVDVENIIYSKISDNQTGSTFRDNIAAAELAVEALNVKNIFFDDVDFLVMKDGDTAHFNGDGSCELGNKFPREVNTLLGVPTFNTTAPTLVSSIIDEANPNKVRLTFTKLLNEAITPNNSYFTLTGKYVVLVEHTADKELTLTVNSVYLNDAEPTIDYDKPAEVSPIQDLFGNKVATFSNVVIINNIIINPPIGVERMTGFTAPQQTVLDTFVANQISNGNFAMEDEVYCFVLGEGNNLIGMKLLIGENKGATFIVDGIKTDGIGQWFNLKFRPGLDGDNFKLNDARLSTFIMDVPNTSVTYAVGGKSSGSEMVRIAPEDNLPKMRMTINDGNFNSAVTIASVPKTLYEIVRTGVNTKAAYIDGVNVGLVGAGDTSTNIETLLQIIGARSAGDSIDDPNPFVANFSAVTIGYISYGSAIGYDHAAGYAEVKALLEGFGVTF